MKKIIAIACLFISCNTASDLSKQAADEIIHTNGAMNVLAAKEGFYKALLEYADDSVAKPQEGGLPVIGKVSLKKYWKGKAGTNDISWHPFKAEAAKSGELGYTLGTWKFTTKDTVMYGMYYTIWKKQTDGKWKFILDGGNNTPKP